MNHGSFCIPAYAGTTQMNNTAGSGLELHPASTICNHPVNAWIAFASFASLTVTLPPASCVFKVIRTVL